MVPLVPSEVQHHKKDNKWNSHEIFQINDIRILARLTIDIIAHAIIVPILVLVARQIRYQRLLNIPMVGSRMCRLVVHILRVIIMRYHIFRYVTRVRFVSVILDIVSIVNTDTAHIVQLLGPLVRNRTLHIPSCLLKSSHDGTLMWKSVHSVHEHICHRIFEPVDETNEQSIEE